ncbi:MAG: flagellar biosynthesis repressor FlbT [Alphaproteobacteria bacterium]|nr:flagellar biosynthesis repressor FlbT [Alphaproteobacteria bacterium]
MEDFMATTLTLKAKEKCAVNGAVLVAGPKGATFSLRNDALVLRQDDILLEKEANTPAKRIYFFVMLSCLDRENAQDYYPRLVDYLYDFATTTSLIDVKQALVNIMRDVNDGALVRALRTARALVEYEANVLRHGKAPAAAKGKAKPKAKAKAKPKAKAKAKKGKRR